MSKLLVCIAIICNALCAGGVYSFPLISSALVKHMHFTQPQLTTIALSGMVGQYPFAALVGKVLDRRGARMCSLAAAMLFALGFGLFSFEVSHALQETDEPSTLAFFKLSFAFGLVGLATVFSYFSIVFSATSTFPAYTGVASGTTMALFGSSPLLLAELASRIFTDSNPQAGLNVTRFLWCLAVVSGTSHALGTFCLPGPAEHAHGGGSTGNPRQRGVVGESTEGCDDEDVDERSSLLRSASSIADDVSRKCAAISVDEVAVPVHIISVREPQHGSVLDLMRDRYFWVLVFVVMVLVGECEMIMANLGSLFLSLPPSQSSASSPASSASLSTEVQLLSLANTLSRLIVGPLADILAPSPTTLTFSVAHPPASFDGSSSSSLDVPPSDIKTKKIWAFPRRQHLSRTLFLLAASLILASTFGWALTSMRTQEDVWVLCVGVGVVYGAVFTVLPGLLSSIYGPLNLGRNFGVLSYAFFLGTSTWAYLYAVIADAHTRHLSTVLQPHSSPRLGLDSSSTSSLGGQNGDVNMCVGPQCWTATFGAALGALALAAGGACVLWRGWRRRV